MDSADRRKSAFAPFLIVLVIVLAVGGAYLAKYTGRTVSYQQTPQSGPTTSTSSPLKLDLISPATTTVGSVITLLGQGFSLTPATYGSSTQAMLPGTDSVIVWLTQQDETNAVADGPAATSTMPSAGVLWQGNPGEAEDSDFNFGINRFLCAQPNPNGATSDSDLSDCSAIFPVADGAYALTVSIPSLGLTSNPETLTVTSPSLSVKSYTDATTGYSLSYPDDMALKRNAPYPPVPGTNVTAMTLTFPKTYYPNSTVTTASIAVAVTQDDCTMWPGGTQSFPVLATTTFSGTGGAVWSERLDNDAAAGNFYSTVEYSTVRGVASGGTQCYRISLFSHLADPGVYSGDAGQLARYSIANAAAQEMLNSVFGQVMRSFSF